MPYQQFSARASSPTMDVIVDMGNPMLNSTVNGFLKVGPVGATHAATHEAFKMSVKESVTKGDLERLVIKAGKEGLQWGMVVGIYSGVEYGIQHVRGSRDWKNEALGGALTCAIMTTADKNCTKEKIIREQLEESGRAQQKLAARSGF